jgi:hypothetical protein
MTDKQRLPEPKDEKSRRKIEDIKKYFTLFNSIDSYVFRFFALLFLVGVEVTLIVSIFQKIEVGAGLLTAITVIAILPILVIRVFDITVLNLSKEGVQAQMLQAEINEALSKVDRLFVLAMSDTIYKLLSLLNEGASVPYKLDDSIRRQLYYLEDVGYVSLINTPLPDEVPDLKLYAAITKTGQEFLEFRSGIKE